MRAVRTRSARKTFGCLIRSAPLGKQRIWRAGPFDAIRLNPASSSKKPLLLGAMVTMFSPVWTSLLSFSNRTLATQSLPRWGLTKPGPTCDQIKQLSIEFPTLGGGMAHNWPQNQRPESRCHYLADCKALSTLSFRSRLLLPQREHLLALWRRNLPLIRKMEPRRPEFSLK